MLRTPAREIRRERGCPWRLGGQRRRAILADTGSGSRRHATSCTGPEVVGCVVVVDLVCAGEPVTAGAALLRGVMERLAHQIPAGARLRLDDAGSALSVILPEHDRTGACDWMHRTLPAVFRDTAAPGEPVLPVGTALRATVHDTDGPVGAQLLQRLDRAGRGDAPSVPVKWGVPIAAGSGGRRRRPDGESSPPSARQRCASARRHRARHERRPPSREMGSAPAEPGCQRPSGRAVIARPSPVVRRGGARASHGACRRQRTMRETVGSRDGAVGDDAELSVEGLGLADLLAGALAAYRAI